jgi:hypothetical protein
MTLCTDDASTRLVVKPAPLSFLFVGKLPHRSPVSAFPRTPSTADPLAETLATSSLLSDDVQPATPKDTSSPPMTASSPNGAFSFRGGVAPPPSPLVAFALSPRLPRSLADVDQRYLFEVLAMRLQAQTLRSGGKLSVDEKVARWQQIAGLPVPLEDEER